MRYTLTRISFVLYRVCEFLRLIVEWYIFYKNAAPLYIDLVIFFQLIDKYMQVIGFTSGFQALPANADNINWAYETRYDRILITPQTSLEELHLGLKCNDILYIINFKKLSL